MKFKWLKLMAACALSLSTLPVVAADSAPLKAIDQIGICVRIAITPKTKPVQNMPLCGKGTIKAIKMKITSTINSAIAPFFVVLFSFILSSFNL